MSSSTTSRDSKEQARSSCSATITNCFCVLSCAQTGGTWLVPEARGGARGGAKDAPGGWGAGPG